MRETSRRWRRPPHDLLCGIDAQAMDFRKALHSLMMRGKEVGDLLIELARPALRAASAAPAPPRPAATTARSIP